MQTNSQSAGEWRAFSEAYALERPFPTVPSVDARQVMELLPQQIQSAPGSIRLLLETTAGAFLLTDEHGEIQQVNSRAAVMFNMPRDELIGLPLLRFITVAHRRDLPKDLRTLPSHPTVTLFEPEIGPLGGKSFPGVLKVTPLPEPFDGAARLIWQILDSPLRSKSSTQPGEDELRALFELTEELVLEHNAPKRLQAIAETVMAVFKPQSAAVYVYNAHRRDLSLAILRGLPALPGTILDLDEGILGRVAQYRRPLLVENYRVWSAMSPQVNDPPITAVAVPIIRTGDVTGVMAIAEIGKAIRGFNWDDVRLLSIFAALAGSNDQPPNHSDVIKDEQEKRRQVEQELKSARKKIRGFAGRLSQVREEERTKVARQLHDELGQLLTSFKMGMAVLAKSQEEILAKSQSLIQLSDSTIESVQRLSTELRPGVLDELGLVGALKMQATDFEERSGIECNVTVGQDIRNVDRDIANALFRIFLEILTNVWRHARATRVDVSLKQESASLVLRVDDDGCGIPEDQINSPKSLGIVGMRERAQAYGGTVTIGPGASAGTTVTVVLPLVKTQDPSR